MANFITTRELRTYAAQRSIKAALDGTGGARGRDVFLSYSHKDREEMPGVVSVLEGHGASVYVDVGDESLPTPPSQQTADILKANMALARKLVVFVTTNSKSSAWIPWELGLGDGLKTSARVALFPAADSAYDQAWAEREYLGLYDRIVWGVLGSGDPRWFVLNRDRNVGTALEKWLKD